MKTLMVLLTTLMVLMFGFGGNAEAKRLGGGKSTGQQSSNVTQSTAAPKPATPAPAAPPVAAPKPWGAMLGGLAAGLGLAWLASSLGLGGAMGNILMFLLIGVAVMVGIGWFMRRKAAAAMPSLQGAGAGAAGNAATPFSYRPENVGNDASARPWERNATAFDATPAAAAATGAAGGSMIGAGLSGSLSGSQNWGVPAGFDTDGFLTAAKRNFVNLQAAWDKSDIAALRAMMTDSMLTEIKSQLAERESQSGNTPNHTEVVMLEARLLGIEESATGYLASVEFSGMIREDASVGASPFREVWNMSKPQSGGSGWLVAGIQALQ